MPIRIEYGTLCSATVCGLRDVVVELCVEVVESHMARNKADKLCSAIESRHSARERFAWRRKLSCRPLSDVIAASYVCSICHTRPDALYLSQ